MDRQEQIEARQYDAMVDLVMHLCRDNEVRKSVPPHLKPALSAAYSRAHERDLVEHGDPTFFDRRHPQDFGEQ